MIRPLGLASRGRAVAIGNADAFAARVVPMIRAMRAGGMSKSAIAAALTAGRLALPRGGTKWSVTAVTRVLKRLELK
jgi:hypothetical protein